MMLKHNTFNFPSKESLLPTPVLTKFVKENLTYTIQKKKTKTKQFMSKIMLICLW